jgi:hypothetical protein
MKSGNLNFLEPSGPLLACNGTALPLSVFLLIISTKSVTLAMFRRMIPDDGPNGPKHVGAI